MISSKVLKICGFPLRIPIFLLASQNYRHHYCYQALLFHYFVRPPISNNISSNLTQPLSPTMCVWEDVTITDCRNPCHVRRLTTPLDKQPTTYCEKARGNPCKDAIRKHTQLRRRCAICNIENYDMLPPPLSGPPLLPIGTTGKVGTGATIKEGGCCDVM
jgi:hypothetical protein